MAKLKSQVQKFRDAARQMDADESEERFNATLKGLAKSQRGANPDDKAGQNQSIRPLKRGR
jgi:hypothetical protein